jgi:hypothetical protein
MIYLTHIYLKFYFHISLTYAIKNKLNYIIISLNLHCLFLAVNRRVRFLHFLTQ